jgi:hypothetical protein
MAWLLVEVGGGEVREVELAAPRVVIGRRPGSQIHLAHPSVSAEHAAIVAERGGWRVEDLTSRNGTLVNGRHVARQRLRDRDLIEVGALRMVFREKALPVRSDADGPQDRRRPASRARVRAEASASERNQAPGVSPAPGLAPPALAPWLPAMPSATVVVRGGRSDGREIPLLRPLTALGRDGSVFGWILGNAAVFHVVSAGSEVALTLDGNPVGKEPVRLIPGQRLVVGDVELELRI